MNECFNNHRTRDLCNYFSCLISDNLCFKGRLLLADLSSISSGVSPCQHKPGKSVFNLNIPVENFNIELFVSGHAHIARTQLVEVNLFVFLAENCIQFRYLKFSAHFEPNIVRFESAAAKLQLLQMKGRFNEIEIGQQMKD